MERKVGNKFNYKSAILEVKEGNGCEKCFFLNEYCCQDKIRNIIGDCTDKLRSDVKPIIFIQNEK
jgi:hypothetical protein